MSLSGVSRTTFAQTTANWAGGGGALDGNWSTGANWSTSLPPTGHQDTSLTFGVTTGTTILNMDLTAPFVLNRLTFTSDVNGVGNPSSLTIGGGDLMFSTSSTGAAPELAYMGNVTTTITQTINNNLQFNSNAFTLRSDNASVFTGLWLGGNVTATGGGAAVLTLTGSSTNTRNFINGNVGQANGTVLSILKDGAGRWELGGTNTIGGGITVNAGALVFSVTNATTVTGPIVVSGGSLTFNGATTFNGVSTITGGVLSFNNATNNITATSAFYVEGGILRANDPGAINFGNVAVTLGNAANATGEISYTDTTAGTITRSFSLLGTGLMTIAGGTTGTLTVNGGLNFADATAKNISLGGAGTAVHTFNAALIDNGAAATSVQKNSTNTWVVTNAGNLFTGGLAINAGQLRVANTTQNLNLANNNLTFGGTAGTVAVLETMGSITSALGAGANQIQFANAANQSGGFSAFGGPLNVTLNGDAATSIMWGGAFSPTTIGQASELHFNSTNANDVVTFANALTLSTGVRTVRVTDNTAATTDWAEMSGIITGTGGLSKAGNGLLILTAANTFTGGATVTNGVLRVASLTNNLNRVANIIRFGAANGTNSVLETSGNLSLTLGATTGSIAWVGSGGFSAYGGNLSVTLNNNAGLTWNSGSFTTTGNELQFNSIYSDGVATLNNAIALGTTTRAIRVTDNPNSAVDYAVIGGIISGGSATGGVIKTGNGLLELAGANTFSGGITISGGYVRGTIANLRLQAVTNPNYIRFNTAANGGGNLETSGSLTNSLGTAAGQIQWRAAGAINATTGGSGGFSAFGGALSVTLNNNNTTPLVWASTANFTDTNAELGFGSILSDNVVTFNNPINLNNAIRTIRVYDNPTTAADYAVMTGTLSSTTPSSGGVIKQGPGTLVLTADSTYTGSTSIRGGTLRLGNGGTTGMLSGIIRLTNSTTAVDPALVFNHSVIVNYGQTGTAVITGAGVGGGVLITGPSTGGVQFNSANTYVQGTTIDSGTVRFGIANALPTTGTVMLNSTGTIDLNGFNGSIGTLTNFTTGTGGVIINNGATAAVLSISQGLFSGTIKDGLSTIALQKLTAGTLTLNGVNNFSGGLLLGGGILYVPDGSYLGSGPLTFSGGQLQTGTSTLNISAALTLTGGMTLGGATTYTFDSAGSINVIGASTLTNASTLGPGGVVLMDDILLGANLTLTGDQDITLNGNINVTGADATTSAARTLTVAIVGGRTFNTNFNLSADGLANALTLRATTPIVVNGTITDGGFGGGLTVAGGSVTISNTTNNFSGGLTLATGGILITPNAGALGSGILRLNAGTLQNDAAQTYTNAVSIGGSVTFTGSQNVSFAASSMSLDAAATLTNNIGVGGLTLTSGSIILNANLGFGAGVAPLILGGNISISGAARTFTNNLSGQTVDANINLAGDGTARQLDIRGVNTNTFVLNGAISDGGLGGIVRYITGINVVNGNNSYNGQTHIFTASTVVVGHDSAFGTSAVTTLTIAPGGAAFLEAAGGPRTLANNITMSTQLTLTGANNFILNGVISPTLAGRTLALGTPITATLGGTLVLGDAAAARQVTLAGGAASTFVVTGLIQDSAFAGGTLNINLTGGGSAIISGSNSYTGVTTLAAGTLVMDNDNAFGTGTLRLNGGTFRAGSGARTIVNPLALGGTVTLTGGGNIIAGNAAATTVSAASVVTLSNAGSLTLNNGLVLGANLTLTEGGALNVSGTSLVTAAAVLTMSNSAVALQNVALGANLTFAGSIAPTISGTVSVTGASRTLTANNVGGITLGNIELGADGVANRALTLGGTGPFALNGVIQDGPGVGGALSINLGTGSSATISGSNSYTGVTTLVTGTLIMDNDNAFGTGTLRLNGGTFRAGSGARTIVNPLALGGTVTLTGGGNIIAGNAAATTVSAASVVTLSNAGSLTLNNGLVLGANLTLTEGGALNVSGTSLVTAAAVLTMSNSAVSLQNVALGGNLSLVGGFAPTVSGVVSLTGGSRTLTVSNVGGLTLGNINLAADAVANRVLTLAGAGGPIVVNGAISDGGNAGAVQVAGGAEVVFNAANSYTLRTTISNGTLRLGTTYANALGMAPLVFGAASGTRAVLETSGTLTNSLGVGVNQVSWIGAGGYSAKGGALGVTLNNDAATAITWNAAGLGSTSELQFSSPTADNTVTLNNTFDLVNGSRTIRVFDGSAAVDAVMTGVIFSTTTTTGGGITKAGTGTFVTTAANTYLNGTTVAAGTFRVGNGGSTGSLASQVITVAGALVHFDRTTSFGQGTITGTGDALVTVTGATLTVTNLNTTGQVTVGSGTLQVGGGVGVQLQALNIAVNSGAVLRVTTTSALTSTADITGGGNMIIAPGVGNTATFTYLGTSTLSGTTILTGTSPILSIGNGTASGSGSLSGNLNISSSTGVVIFNRPDDVAYNGAISYTAAAGAQIRKLNTNVLTLGGTSTYTAATSVAAGTLNVTGALGATPITVANNAGIQLSGTIGNATGTVNSNAVFRSIGGNAAGTWVFDGGILEIGGAVTNTISNLTLGGLNLLNAGATINLDLDAPATNSSSLGNLLLSVNDRITLTNLPTINAGSIINLSSNVNTTGGYYLLMSGYAGTILNANLLTINAPDGFGRQVFNQDGMLFVQLTTVSTLTWDGTVAGAAWDAGVTANWNGGTATYNNVARDSVVFNDAAAGSTSVNIVGPLQPTVVTVNNSALTYTFNGGAIAGDGGINKSGSGKLVLLNDNTFTGLLSIAGGTVQLGNGAAAGSIPAAATVAFDNGGTLRVERNDSYTLAGNISGMGNLEQAGTGTLVLTGNNSYVGATTVGGGTLSIQGAGVISDLSTMTINSGTFAINGSAAQVLQSIVVNAGGDVRVNTAALTTPSLDIRGGQVNVGGGALTVPTFAMTSGTLNVVGANTTLTSITFGGITNTAGNPTAMVNVGSGRTLNLFGTLTYTANNDSATDSSGVVIGGAGSISLSAARTWNIQDSANTDVEVTVETGITTATSAIIKTGGGTLYLKGASTSTAVHTIAQGTIRVGNNSALGSIAGAVISFSGGMLQADGISRTLINNIGLTAANGIFGGTAGSLIFNGTVLGSTASRTMTFNQGAPTIFNGAVRFGEDSATARSMTLAGDGEAVFNGVMNGGAGGGATATRNLIVSMDGTLGPGTVRINGNNTYAGATSLRNGTIVVTHTNAFGAASSAVVVGTATMNNNRVALLTAADMVLARDLSVIASPVTASIFLGGDTAHTSTFSGNVALARDVHLTAASNGTAVFTGNLTGAGGVTKVGTGIVALAGAANDYAGGTTIREGALAVAVASALGSNAGPIVIDPTSTGANPGLYTAGALTLTQDIVIQQTALTSIVLGGGTAVTSTFSGNITFSQGITLRAATSGTVYFTGTLDDGGSTVGTVTKDGAGTVVLLGTNAWTGITTINDGVLDAQNNLTGTVYVNAGGTFTGAGAAGSMIVNQGGSVVYTGNQTGTTTISSGTVDVSSGSDVSGLIGVVGGTLNANNGSVISGTITVAGGAFNINGGSTISGTLGLSSGQVNVNNGGTFGGPTIINGGTFSVNNGGTVAAGTGIDVNSGGNFVVNSGGAVTGDGLITVGGNMTANGAVGSGSTTVIVENGGTLNGTGGIGGAIVVNSGGILAPGNSVGTLTGGSLTLTGGAKITFEFRDVTLGPGVGWDLIDIGAGLLDLGDASALDPIEITVDAWALDNSAHDAGSGLNNFNPNSSYEWLFIKTSNLGSPDFDIPPDDDLSRRFVLIDDAPNKGVFGTGIGNAFTRPNSSVGQGTFRVAFGNLGQGNGLYITYSAIPEPGSMILAGFASLGAGWYGRRRLRRTKDAPPA